MKRRYNWYIRPLLICAGTLAVQNVTADNFLCERYNDDISGFRSVSAYEPWHPRQIILQTDNGEKKGNQLRFTEDFVLSGGEKVSRITYLLQTRRLLLG